MPSQPGIISTSSGLSVDVATGRVEAAIAERGLTLFARIDHAKGAHDAGLALRPTLLLIFGAARGGTPLMQIDQIVGIDLPLKMLIWEDEGGATQLSYVDPLWLVEIRQLGDAARGPAEKLHGLLSDLARAAAH